jgi:hypothetical protein
MKKMIAVVLAVTLSSLVTLAACSSRTGYDMLRLHQDQRCLDLQGADRDACMRQNTMTYDEYQRQLKERDEGR